MKSNIGDTTTIFMYPRLIWSDLHSLARIRGKNGVDSRQTINVTGRVHFTEETQHWNQGSSISRPDDFQCNNGHKDRTKPEGKTWIEMP